MKEILDKFCPKTSFDEDPFVGEALKERREDLEEALDVIEKEAYRKGYDDAFEEATQMLLNFNKNK